MADTDGGKVHDLTLEVLQKIQTEIGAFRAEMTTFRADMGTFRAEFDAFRDEVRAEFDHVHRELRALTRRVERLEVGQAELRAGFAGILSMLATWKNRGRRPADAARVEVARNCSMSYPRVGSGAVRILGLDPGSRVCGYGVIDDRDGAAALCRVRRADRAGGSRDGGAARRDRARAARGDRRARARGRRGRGRVRAPEPAQRARARAGARHGARGDRAVRAARRVVPAGARQEDGHRLGRAPTRTRSRAWCRR